MAETADIVIVGAGIIGACTAFQLARRSKAKIIVLEKGAGPGEGSTGASSAVCRAKYTRPEMVRLARHGIQTYDNWSAFTGLSDPLAYLHRDGVLWLGDNKDWVEPEAVRLDALGVRTASLDDQALKERFPAINPCVLGPDFEEGLSHQCKGGARHLLELDGGYVDPVDALQDVIRAGRAFKVDIRFHATLSAVVTENGRVRGVATQDGARISCDTLINTAGPWCNEVFAFAGLPNPWPLRATRIQIALVDRSPDLIGDIPVCADPPGGIYFRTQNRGQQIIVGSVLEEDEQEDVANPDHFAKFADDDFIRTKLYALQHRLPGLDRLSGVRGYSGLYTMNRADVHPIVGKTPLSGFHVANGFSGHGFKVAPAIGSLLAQQVTGVSLSDFDTDVTADFLAFDRGPIWLSSRSVLA